MGAALLCLVAGADKALCRFAGGGAVGKHVKHEPFLQGQSLDGHLLAHLSQLFASYLRGLVVGIAQSFCIIPSALCQGGLLGLQRGDLSS